MHGIRKGYGYSDIMKTHAKESGLYFWEVKPQKDPSYCNAWD